MIGNAACPQFPESPAAQLWLLWLHLDFPEVVHLVYAVEVVLHASDPSDWTKPWPIGPALAEAEIGTFDGHMLP